MVVPSFKRKRDPTDTLSERNKGMVKHSVDRIEGIYIHIYTYIYAFTAEDTRGEIYGVYVEV